MVFGMKSLRRLFLCVPLALAACSGNDVSQTLGLGKDAPDEFVVVSRPPLVVPPDFDLTPPRPGEEAPHAVSTEAQARKLLLGTEAAPASLDQVSQPTVETAVTPVLAADAPTAASANFLKKVGADEARSDIRQQLSVAATAPAKEKKKEADSLYDQLMEDESQEPVVDPAGESERLRKNKDEGKPLTEGDTPTEDTTPKSVIDRVF